MLLECLQKVYKVLEAISLAFVQLHLYRGSSTNFQVKDGVLKVYHLICLFSGQFCKVFRLNIIVGCVELLTLLFDY